MTLRKIAIGIGIAIAIAIVVVLLLQHGLIRTGIPWSVSNVSITDLVHTNASNCFYIIPITANRLYLINLKSSDLNLVNDEFFFTAGPMISRIYVFKPKLVPAIRLFGKNSIIDIGGRVYYNCTKPGGEIVEPNGTIIHVPPKCSEYFENYSDIAFTLVAEYKSNGECDYWTLTLNNTWKITETICKSKNNNTETIRIIRLGPLKILLEGCVKWSGGIPGVVVLIPRSYKRNVILKIKLS